MYMFPDRCTRTNISEEGAAKPANPGAKQMVRIRGNEPQCGAVIAQSIFSKILTKDIP